MKKASYLTAVLFLVVLFGFAVGFWLLPDRSFSVLENRGLQPMPKWNSKHFFAGTYAEQINDYYADQFPLRDALVGVKGASEIALGKAENDGILLGRNGYLARRRFAICRADGSITQGADYFDPAELRAACAAIRRTAEALPDRFSVLLTGRNLDIVSKAFDYPEDHSRQLQEWLANELQGVPQVSVCAGLRQAMQAGDAVYYRTDHHWTTKGAYLAYAEVMRSFGMENEIIPESAFTKQTVSNAFYGSLWSAAGMRWVEPDTVELWLLGDEDAYTVVADGTPCNGFYQTDWLQRKDCYSVFLDGTHDVVTIQKQTQEPRQRLLLLKDSFANSLAPFLARHFDLVLFNLSSSRTDYTHLSALAAEWDADRVMLVYTMENLITSKRIQALR